jgi:hypothetical protein
VEQLKNVILQPLVAIGRFPRHHHRLANTGYGRKPRLDRACATKR